ncbi:MAG: dTDP-4-dehydrorhamnose 3,5-epimerase family protein [Actinomycetota bacterium]|nr:dTDP-4-dehydrorhamnose 3,5-epimerase family protein [Actinomycetota bacterium]
MTAVHRTSIDGLLRVELDVHGDERGWFKESWQRETLVAQGLPDLRVVQHNVSYNEARGVTRGIHAEPWNKFISPAAGRVFAAIVDLRVGSSFGRVETFELGVGQALFVPPGLGNSYCTLEPHTVYSYLVDAHWSAHAQYVNVNLFDATLAIAWPVSRAEMTVSEKDLAHPGLHA